MNGRILFAVVLAAVMIGAVLAPMGTVVADGTESTGDEVDLEIDVEQNKTVTVTVTDNDSTVENATVNVSVDDEDASYADEGNYTTDDDGIVELSEPDETVNVTIETTYENASTEVKKKLEAADDGEGDGDETANLEIDVEQNGNVTIAVTANDTAAEKASVNVTADENESYADEGNYTTDDDGIVVLDVPEETVNVTIEATYENETETTNVTLEAEDDDGIDDHENFGAAVSTFVHDNMDYAGGPFGQSVSEFVTTHNPGNGPPDHVNPPGHANASDEPGPPEHAGDAGNESDQGPPEHAGGSDTDTDDDGQGPPDHAGADDEDDEGDD